MNSFSTFTSLSEAICSLFGNEVKIDKRSSISGGDINRAFKLSLSNGKDVFMKANAFNNSGFFTAEALGLSALSSPSVIGVPRLLCTGTDKTEGISFLLLEMLEPESRVSGYWEILGHELAALHSTDTAFLNCSGKFGFNADNYIGMSIQINTPGNSWVDFFRSCRLKPQFERAQDYFDPSDIKRIASLLDRLDEILIEPDAPSLLHGDLWGGNVITGNDGKVWIIDPAVYIGHREVDLAMTELFGGFSRDFYLAYKEAAPLHPGYEDRREIYNLYQLLNHLNMFGGSYYSSVINIVRHFAK